MTDANGCPNCGAERPSGGLGGLCPRCLLEHAPEVGLPDRAGASVLVALAATVGSVPQVLLRDDTATGAAFGAGRAALRHRDARLARPLGSVATLRRDRSRRHGRRPARDAMSTWAATWPSRSCSRPHREKPELVRRFVEEAQIGGQLQHPGIVPVYELGSFADRRPFFTMKLVKGHTLAELLKERASPAEDRPRFLAIFAQVCQTMAYAHARGVIHRDLKPSNIMVGSFGEVQVMDWGLAKVLPRGAASPMMPRRAANRAQQTFIATARSGSDAERSQAGSRDGHARVHGPRAGARRDRPGGRAGRRLRAGLDPLRDPDRAGRRSPAVPPARSIARRPWATWPTHTPGSIPAAPTPS